jgi:hypothetical protein
MSRTTLDRVLEDLRKLSSDELARVYEEIGALVSSSPGDDREEQFLQALLGAGLISEIKPVTGNSLLDREPVPITGKPLSETIVEERR